MFRLIAFIFALLLMLSVVQTGFAQPQKLPDDPRKAVHEIAVRLYEGKAMEAEYQACQALHRAAQDDTNRRICLHLAAQYQRQILKNPIRTLEIVLPHLIGNDEFNSWKKTNQAALRSIASGKTGAVYNLTELPDVPKWRIEGSRGPLALEAAYALYGMGKVDRALQIIETVGMMNTDDVRVLAAECAADLCVSNKEYEKANEYFKFGQELLKKLRSRDHYYERGDRIFSGDERSLISRRLKEKLKKSEDALASQKMSEIVKKKEIVPLPAVGVHAWPAATPKVDRLDIKAPFIVCMISDGEGGAFVGTEDYGVYHYDNEGNVKQYTDKDGMGDPNAYALAIDKLGRLWAGNLNTGVSVFNGETWRNYDVIDGPIGERIFDIQTCPVDGDVWLVTSAGLTRYKIDADEWKHYTREDGLLEDQAASLAFKKDGTLIVGTQCHGLAIFNRDRNGNYKHAKNITAPERYGSGNCSPVPLVPYGNGLPTNQINQIIVAKDETIWIATPTGLVKSDKNLSKMQYVRGRDYADKVRGLYGGAPKEWKECPKEIMEQLLPEDYITCLSEDANGTIWIGTRQKGFMAIDPKTGRRGTGDRASMGMADNYVSAILPMEDGSPLIGLYIGGVIRPKETLTTGHANEDSTRNTVAREGFPKLPSPIKPPTVEELRTMYYVLKDHKPEKSPPKIIALNDDWRTKGDWIDRYGMHSAVLCAQAGGGTDFICGYLGRELRSFSWIGGNHSPKDAIRRWVHWVESQDKRVLQCYNLGGRKQSEWDDHKEVYPLSMDGPHIYAAFNMPPGKYLISLYFFNKDGHQGNNRLRDYIVSVGTFRSTKSVIEKFSAGDQQLERNFASQPNQQKLRIRDFWGGVYKRYCFEIADEELVFVRLDANYSFNTIVSGIFFNPVGEMKPTAPIDAPFPPPRQPRDLATEMENPTEEFWWAFQCTDQLLCWRDASPAEFHRNSRRLLLPIIRALANLDNGIPRAPAGLLGKDKELLRSDMARIFGGVQLFDFRDMTEYNTQSFNSYWWDGRSKKGREFFYEFKWNKELFNDFINTRKGVESW